MLKKVNHKIGAYIIKAKWRSKAASVNISEQETMFLSHKQAIEYISNMLLEEWCLDMSIKCIPNQDIVKE